MKEQLSINQTQLFEKSKLEETLKTDIHEKSHLVSQLKTERDSLVLSIEKMKDAIPASVIMLNKDNIITNWNKKAGEIFGFNLQNTDITKMDFFKDERITNASAKIINEKESVNIKSVSIKDKQGNPRLTDITQMPMVDSDGEMQGTIMVFDDISSQVGLQAELDRKQKKLDDVTMKYQNAYNKLSLVDQEIDATNNELKQRKEKLNKKISEINNMNLEMQKQNINLEVKKKELESADQNIIEKSHEVNRLETELENNHNELEEKTNEVKNLKIDLQERENVLNTRNDELNKTIESLNKTQEKLLNDNKELDEIRENLEIKQEELDMINHDFTSLQAEFGIKQLEIEKINGQLEEANDEKTQLTIKLERRQSEINTNNEEIQGVKQNLKERIDETNILQSEMDKLTQDFESTRALLDIKNKEVTELNEELKAGKSALNWFKVDNEIEEIKQKTQLNKKSLEEKTILLEEFESNIQALTQEMLDKQNDFEIQKNDLITKQEVIEQLENKLDNSKNSLTERTDKLNKKENEIQKLQNELKNRLDELGLGASKLDEQEKTIEKLQKEKNQLLSNFEHMKDAIPSSVIMVDKDDMISNWNKKAEELFQLNTKTDLSSLDLMKKERVSDGFKGFQKDKKPVKVDSLSIRSKKGDILLTNITRMPIFDDKNEFQGSFLIVNDVSDTAEIQAELKRNQDELEKLDQQFKEVHTKFTIMDREKNAFNKDLITIRNNQDKALNQITGLLKEKQKELDLLDKSISLKTDELGNISTTLKENQNTLSFVESELTRKQMELETGNESIDTIGSTWREKLKIYDEIDKSLETVDDNLKTKKLKEDNDEI